MDERKKRKIVNNAARRSNESIKFETPWSRVCCSTASQWPELWTVELYYIATLVFRTQFNFEKCSHGLRISSLSVHGPALGGISKATTDIAHNARVALLLDETPS